jgi:hypothetical protein
MYDCWSLCQAQFEAQESWVARILVQYEKGIGHDFTQQLFLTLLNHASMFVKRIFKQVYKCQSPGTGTPDLHRVHACCWHAASRQGVALWARHSVCDQLWLFPGQLHVARACHALPRSGTCWCRSAGCDCYSCCFYLLTAPSLSHKSACACFANGWFSKQ